MQLSITSINILTNKIFFFFFFFFWKAEVISIKCHVRNLINVLWATNYNIQCLLNSEIDTQSNKFFPGDFVLLNHFIPDRQTVAILFCDCATGYHHHPHSSWEMMTFDRKMSVEQEGSYSWPQTSYFSDNCHYSRRSGSYKELRLWNRMG
jgi:hypothetical protein